MELNNKPEEIVEFFRGFGSSIGDELIRAEITNIVKAVKQDKVTKKIVLKAIWFIKILIKRNVNEVINKYGKENIVIVKRLAEKYCNINYSKNTVSLK